MKSYQLIAIFFVILISCTTQTQEEETATDSPKQEETNNAPIPQQPPRDYRNPTNTLGVGLVLCDEEFSIYNDSSMTEIYAEINMYQENVDESIYSKYFSPGYGIMHFVGLGETEKTFEVLTNFSTIKFIPKSSSQFITWEEYIMGSFGIRRSLDQEVQSPIYLQPSTDADTLMLPEGHELLCQMEVKGDWVKFRYDCFYNLDTNPHEGEPCHDYIDKCDDPLIGWLQWRKENEVLIDIFLRP